MAQASAAVLCANAFASLAIRKSQTSLYMIKYIHKDVYRVYLNKFDKFSEFHNKLEGQARIYFTPIMTSCAPVSENIFSWPNSFSA